MPAHGSFWEKNIDKRRIPTQTNNSHSIIVADCSAIHGVCLNILIFFTDLCAPHQQGKRNSCPIALLLAYNAPIINAGSQNIPDVPSIVLVKNLLLFKVVFLEAPENFPPKICERKIARVHSRLNKWKVVVWICISKRKLWFCFPKCFW